MLQTNNTGVCSQYLSHTGPAPAHGACVLPAHTAQVLGYSARNRRRPALGCMHLPGLSHSGSSTWVVLRDADSVGPAFCALPRSSQPACSLVDNVSLGLQLPPSSSGCLSLEGDGLQLAISVQSFVLWAGLVMSYIRAFCVALVSPLFCARTWLCLRLRLLAW